ncbi:MAG TPA: transposase, partial [Chthoniobacterales bacterium]
LSAKLHRRAQRKHRRSGRKVRLFTQFKYKAKTWDKKRRIIAKAEHSDRGANPRYVVTNLEGGSERLYDDIYCARGEMENRIKEQQLGLFSDRTSCHAWWANQFRLLLSSAAYVLLEALRRLGLSGTEWARAQVGTIRLRLLKIGAIITRNTRRIRLRGPGTRKIMAA